MTHDELLDRIAQAGLEPHGNVMPTHLVLALRAVVELHEPHRSPDGDVDCSVCENTSSHWSGVPYPCPTIQAITNRSGE